MFQKAYSTGKMYIENDDEYKYCNKETSDDRWDNNNFNC